jgi:protein-disulfide isomerase
MPPKRSPTRRRSTAWRWWLLIAVVVVAAVVGVLVQRSRSGTEQATVTKPASAVGPNGGTLVEQASAPVTITEYGDFQCPGCAALYERWNTTLDQLIQQGRVKFEFVALAYLDRGTTESERSAAASVCAADAGKFLEYENLLYTKQSPSENSGYLTQQRLLLFGTDAGITDPQFANCVRIGRYDGWVRQNTDAASQRGVTSTPTVLVNGRQISTAVAADPMQLMSIVDQASQR